MLRESQWSKNTRHAAREPMQEDDHISSCCVKVNGSLRWKKLEQEERM
jgi:hypothetical protein